MKATSFVLTVFGALLAGAVAFAGSTPAKIQQAKPAVTQKVAGSHVQKEASSLTDKTQRSNVTAKQTKPSDKTGTMSTEKAKTRTTAARQRVHQVKHQPKRPDTKQQTQKKS